MPVGRFDFVVAGADDQVDPSIDGQFVVYAGPGTDGDVLLYDIENDATQVIGGGSGKQDSPDVYFSTAIYRTTVNAASFGIVITSWPTDQIQRQPPQGGDGDVSNPAVHQNVAAWEHRTSTHGADIVVSRYRAAGAPYTLSSPGDTEPSGDQHAPAVFDDLVAYVDDAQQGSVWLHDSSGGERNWAQICDGRATGVSVGSDGARYVIAVARSASGDDEDIEVYDRTGQRLAALPVAGPQRNPHLSGDWVAFEDYSTAFAQVVVWRWKTPAGEPNLVFVPHPSETQQHLNDLSLALSDEVRVVFEDTKSAETGRDIALYRLAVNPIVYDDQPNGYPIGVSAGSCDDPNAVVLATLELTREEGKPRSKSARFDAPPPAGREDTPVLVCIHGDHVSSGWVRLDGEAIATPSDFDAPTVDLTVPAEVEDGRGRISAVVAGKPGAKLTVRVLADPGRADGDVGDCRDDDDRRDDGDGDDGDHDGGDDDGGDDGRDRDGHRKRRGDDHDRCRSGGECGRRTQSGAAGDAGVIQAAGERRFDGGCGSAGGLGSLAALGLLLLRRRKVLR